MTTHYVTYFDSHYLSRGLTLHRSMCRHIGDFHLWIICFDDLTHQILRKLALERVTLVTLEEFENDDLRRVKPLRTRQEYCWTCTPATIRHVLNAAPEIPAVTYLDADTMFFSSPEPAIQEAGDAPIVLTEHHWLPGYDLSAESGTYSVQYLTFSRTSAGLAAIQWWYDRCIEWCYARFENGKFGDQKYLDDWLTRFSGVHVIRHPGIGLAPWNNSGFSLNRDARGITVSGNPLILYHFHSTKLFRWGISYAYGWYPIGKQVREWIYRPYFAEIAVSHREICRVEPTFSGGLVPFPWPVVQPRSIYHFAKSAFKDLRDGRYLYRSAE